jgi:hypothetical protein
MKILLYIGLLAWVSLGGLQTKAQAETESAWDPS